LLAIKGSSGAGWTFPSASMARDVTVCSPEAGFGQSRVQIVQAWAAPLPSPRVAAIQGPPSTRASTRAIGAPQAAPTTR
jgi:hypothetical protein